MALAPPKYAVYFGTITLDDGTPATYTALQIATFYNVQDQPYLAVDLAKPEPFANGKEYMQYFHLKPLRDGRYYDAKERYNHSNEVQFDEDFDARKNGKWAVRPETESDEDIG